MAKTTRLTQQDLQIYPSQRLTDTDDGGGQMVGTPLTGADNELFPPVSDVDRTMGSFDARLVYPAVLRPDAEPLYGGHFIVSEPPQAENVSFLAFRARNYGEHRADIMPRIEAYSVPTIESRMTLMGKHLAGIRLVQAYQRVEAPLPVLGSRFCLQFADGDKAWHQYFRVMRLEHEVRTFEVEQNGVIKEIERRVLKMETSNPLVYDFEGVAYPMEGYANAKTKIAETQVADSASYFGVRPLAAPLAKGDATAQVDTIFEKLVPTSTVETAWADQYPVGTGAWLETAPRQVVARYTEGFNYQFRGNVYFSVSVLPGSVELRGYTDNGKGSLLHQNGTALRVDYAAGVLYGLNTREDFEIYAVPAVYVSGANYTAIIAIDDTNQGTQWAPFLDPKPANGSVSVSFLSGGQWYVIKDGGDYILRDEAGNGCGQVTRNGSCVISLPALPDVGSKIVIGWVPLDAYSSIDGSEPGRMAAPAQQAAASELSAATLDNIVPGSLTVTAGSNSGKDAKGLLSGSITGWVDYSSGKITVSGGGSGQFTVKAQRYRGGNRTLKDISVEVLADLLTGSFGGAVKKGSAMLELRAALTETRNYKYIWDQSVEREGFLMTLYDDGAGGLTYNGQALSGSNINYQTGTFSVPMSSFVFQGRGRAFEEVSLTAGSPALKVVRIERGGTIRLPARQLIPAFHPRGTASYFADHAAIRVEDVNVTITDDSRVVDVLAEVPYPRRAVFNSWIFEVGGVRLYERGGVLYRDIDHKTGNGKAVGALTAAGKLSFSDTGLAQNSVTVVAGIYTNSDMALAQYYGRTPAAPVKPQSFTVYAQTGEAISATADAEGRLNGGFGGKIDTMTGFFEVTSEEPFAPESLRFNAVTRSSIPLDSSIIGIDAVRLPPDGQVPIYRNGDMVVIGNKHAQQIGSAFTSGQTVQLTRKNIDRLCLLDADGKHVTADKYSVDLSNGKLTFASPLDLSDYTMPLTAAAMWEEENRVVGTDITGRLKLQFPVGRDYPQEGTYVSSAVVGGDLLVRATEPFSQQAWDKVWSDSIRGDELLARLNVKDYPIALTSDGAITQRWLLVFLSDSQFELYGEQLGLVVKSDILSDLAPTNPATGKPYFTLPKLAFGGGWAARNCVRFNTFSAQLPVWILRAVQPSPEKQSERDGFTACLRGNTVIDD